VPAQISLSRELDAAFLHNQKTPPADRADRHRAEQKRHCPADQQPDEELRIREREFGSDKLVNVLANARILPLTAGPTETMKLLNSETAAITAEPMAIPW